MALKDWKKHYNEKYQKSWEKGNDEITVFAYNMGHGAYQWSVSIFRDEIPEHLGNFDSENKAISRAKKYMQRN